MTISLPFSKINKELREVWGAATQESLDRQGEIVDFEASKKAFADLADKVSSATGGKSLGPVREMHQPKAIGRLISVIPDEANKRIWVGAKLSDSQDGQDAWQKVQEGVLTGFSIGAPSCKREIRFSKGGQPETHVVDFALSEVSLVDLPACYDSTFAEVKLCKGVLAEIDAESPRGEDIPQPMTKVLFQNADCRIIYEEKNMADELEKAGKKIGPSPKPGQHTPPGAQVPNLPSLKPMETPPAPAKSADNPSTGKPGGAHDEATIPVSVPDMQGKAAEAPGATVTESYEEAAEEHAEMGEAPPVANPMPPQAKGCPKCGYLPQMKQAAAGSDELKKAFSTGIDGLQKAVFAKLDAMASGQEDLRKRIEQIEKTPMPGGPARTELPNGVAPVEKAAGSLGNAEMEQQLLLKAAQFVMDPLAKDAMLRQAATLDMKKILRGEKL